MTIMPTIRGKTSQKQNESNSKRSRRQESSSSSASSTSEDSDEEVNTSSTSRRGTQKKSAGKKVSASGKSPQKQLREKDLSKLVNDCVYYLLVSDKKYAIKKADITKHVLKDHRNAFKVVILRAKETLKKVFGIRIIEIAENKGHYILVNYDNNMDMSVGREEETPFQGLLFYVLTVIWMRDGTLPEDELWRALNALDPEIDVESHKVHPVFGDVKKFITIELVKKRYITYEKIHSDPPTYEFQWGPRASYEVNKEKMLAFVCDVYGNNPIEWISQHQQITSRE